MTERRSLRRRSQHAFCAEVGSGLRRGLLAGHQAFDFHTLATRFGGRLGVQVV
jgi:hypothetical protein